MNVVSLRNILVKGMLGCHVVAAIVAVVFILIGSFDEIAWKSIGTVFSAIIHLSILLGVISMTASKSDNPTVVLSGNVTINTATTIAALSFFTSVFGIWDVMSGSIVAKLYVTYIVTLILVLHAKTLVDVAAFYKKVRPYVYGNLFVALLVAMMVIGLAWSGDMDLLSGFYGRLLAASAIVDVTLSIVTMVLFKLYLQKNPELQQSLFGENKPVGVGRIIVGVLLLVFVVWPSLMLMLRFTDWG